ncbi:MAG: hypothetical protein ACRDIB_00690, partial [Ardenticatenaceae bacterium]
PVERSKAEVETILRRYGADAFMHGWDTDKAIIQFRAKGRFIRFVLPLPAREDFRFKVRKVNQFDKGLNVRLSEAETSKAWEQAQRQRWRALVLAVKAKLEAVESGIATFEDEFLAYTVLPNGATVGTWLQPQLQEAYDSGKMPPMLPPGN